MWLNDSGSIIMPLRSALKVHGEYQTSQDDYN